MAMSDTNDNVVIFGPAASGKCDAIERCIEEYGKEHMVALLTTKTALLIKAYEFPNVTCYNWNTDLKKIQPEWIKEKYDVIIIDGFCENWQEIVKHFDGSRIIMAMRAESNKDLSGELKQSFRIVAKSGFVDQERKSKGITSVRLYKG